MKIAVTITVSAPNVVYIWCTGALLPPFIEEFAYCVITDVMMLADGIDGINQQINLGNSYYSHLKYRVRSNLLVGLTDYRTLVSQCSTSESAFR